MVAASKFTGGTKLCGSELHNTEAGCLMNGVESGLTPTERAAGVDMSVDVASGYFYITQTRYTYGGGNQVVNASDPTNPRWDIIYFQSDGIHYTVGTPGSTPIMPSLPAASILAAAVYVAAGAVIIQNVDIRDERTLVPGQNTLQADRVLAASIADAKLASTMLKRLGVDNTYIAKVWADGSGTYKTLSNTPYSNVWTIYCTILSMGIDSITTLAIEGTPLATVTNATETIIAHGAKKSSTATDWVFTVIKGTTVTPVPITMGGGAVSDITIAWNRGGTGSNTFATCTLEVFGDY
jgi:hypothetical protein